MHTLQKATYLGSFFMTYIFLYKIKKHAKKTIALSLEMWQDSIF